jgi:hypothetical protein
MRVDPSVSIQGVKVKGGGPAEAQSKSRATPDSHRRSCEAQQEIRNGDWPLAGMMDRARMLLARGDGVSMLGVWSAYFAKQVSSPIEAEILRGLRRCLIE